VVQKAGGTNRHTALAKWLADDDSWRGSLGEWDADGVEWAGEYIRTHAPMGDHPLLVEQTNEVTLSTFDVMRGTPDVACGPVLFDLKGRHIDDYREQMAGYVILLGHPRVEIHVLFATERRALRSSMERSEAANIVEGIAERLSDPRTPVVCDFCGWCANRGMCPAFCATGRTGAQVLGLHVPSGNIEEITDADGLGALRRAADALAEWATYSRAYVTNMAVKKGVVASGYIIRQRKGTPSIPDAWSAIQASGVPIEMAGKFLSITLGDLAKAYAEQNSVNQTTAKTDLERRLGPLIQRGSDIRFLKAQ